MGGGESFSTQTVIENGRQKTISKKTRIDNHGNTVTEVTEEYKDPYSGQIVKNKYISN